MDLVHTTLTCAFTQWSPGLGDNNFVGWLTVVVYLLAAGATGALAWRMTGSEAVLARERRFWTIASALLLFLAVNKQLDLQSALTAIARCHAQLTGWYAVRRIIQEDFIIAIAVGGFGVLGLMALMLRGILGRVWLALLGLGFVCVFVVVRAASFHHVDVLLGQTALGLKMNWLLELPGPTLVGLVAWHRLRTVRPVQNVV